MNVLEQMFNIVDFFKWLWAFLDSIILVPGTQISFASALVVFAVLAVLSLFLFRSFGAGAGASVLSLFSRNKGTGGSKDV